MAVLARAQLVSGDGVCVVVRVAVVLWLV